MSKIFSNTDQSTKSYKTSIIGTHFVPMLFSTPMVQAILNGTKTETRRIIKFPKDYDGKEIFLNGSLGLKYTSNDFDGCVKRWNFPINVNDIIWVRETFVQYPVISKNGTEIETEYKADESPIKFRWKPSLFMPKDACRIFLKCISVHAERLQDIDEQSAINEGIEDMLLNVDTVATAYRNYMTTYKDLQKDHWSHVANDAIESYMTLWQKINGIESWNKNPFVWVYKFERTERPNDFL